MDNDKRTMFLPILIIAVGSGWLLTALEVTPAINWVWALGLAVVGVFTFVLAGYNKFSVVVGPFFVLASCLSVLRQTENLSINLEVPILVISIGVLMLVAHSPAIPIPSWIDLSHHKKADEPSRSSAD